LTSASFLARILLKAAVVIPPFSATLEVELKVVWVAANKLLLGMFEGHPPTLTDACIRARLALDCC
jgi:hypothetical protein